jgi:hypothetical protein
MNPNPQPHYPQPKRRFSSSQLTAIIIVGVIFGSCALCGIIGTIGNLLDPQKSAPTANAPTTVQPSPATANDNVTAAGAAAGRYFDGDKACKFLAGVSGLNLGSYVPYKNSEGYTCDGGERVIKLSCNPATDALCNEVSFSVDGEKEGATSAELSYMGMSLHPGSHKRDTQAFVQYANQLAEQALGTEMDSEMRQYLIATGRFLPMKPEPDLATIERHTLKKKIGTGFVKILTRKNDLPGGTAYFLFFTVYPDERWSNK